MVSDSLDARLSIVIGARRRFRKSGHEREAEAVLVCDLFPKPS